MAEDKNKQTGTKWVEHEALCVGDDECPLEVAVIKSNLSVLGMTPARQHAYLRVDAVGLGLTSLENLRGFPNLQFINVSGNKLRSLEPLGALRNLIRVDASRNRLLRTQTFTAPNQLEVVDMSYNEIEEVGEWGVHKYLQELNLRGNKISEVGLGLVSNMELRVLDLAENQISDLSNHLDNLGLRALSLAENSIRSLEGVAKLPKLQVLDIQNNQVESLSPLKPQHMPRLRKLCASQNRLPDMLQVEFLQDFTFLCDLFLAGNPLDSLPFYRAQVLHRLPRLRLLDEHIVIAEEKIKAEVIYGSDVDRRQQIFQALLPEEPFEDRRLVKHEQFFLQTRGQSQTLVPPPEPEEFIGAEGDPEEQDGFMSDQEEFGMFGDEPPHLPPDLTA
mmetsp:Transcript_11324/g.26067  ORF Transcript_11324/g.26067 Transcript_11324/m.26067 type:complete len:389 (-) Transcript_11324:111-1277(-)|eukprot:CAMPEP_0178413870 /NCGR_PEP_ID=MMETSP0689_2-20121128/22748_1 /TAXON_ID=160604 /ORGANISM="Amphidinium massartii, Strain CS-259" /LENGTH=388 /DNA_ID=CAMNT_0020035151 /DNA_START=77 /DNA_END=1243 /DNA_ORIENTATION=+